MAKKKLPEDPRDYYVHHPETSLEDLAQLYKGQRGCSLANLKIRSSKEKWVEQLDQVYTETKLKTDEKLIEANATQAASQMKRVGGLFDLLLSNMERDFPLMGATIQDGEGFPNKYHLETWKQGLASYLKPDGSESSAPPPKIVKYMGVSDERV